MLVWFHYYNKLCEGNLWENIGNGVYKQLNIMSTNNEHVKAINTCICNQYKVNVVS